MSSQTHLHTDSELSFEFETWTDAGDEPPKLDQVIHDVKMAGWLLDQIITDHEPRTTVIFHEPTGQEA